MSKHFAKVKVTNAGMTAGIGFPWGYDISNALVFSTKDMNSMTNDDWQFLKNTLEANIVNTTDPEVKARYEDRLRYVENMMKAIGYDHTLLKPPMKEMSNMDMIELIFSNPELAREAATRFADSSDTDKKRIVKYIKSFDSAEPIRRKRQAEIIDESLIIRFPWLLITQPSMELIMLRKNLSGLKSKSTDVKKVIDFIDHEMAYRKTENMSLKDVESSCDLVKLKEARDRITAYLASTINYFNDTDFTLNALTNDNFMKPFHMYAGRLLKHLNKLAENITARISQLSMAENDNRYTVQVNTCINRLNAYHEQLNEWFTGNPSKKYSVEIAYIMPSIKSIHDTLKNMYDLYVWYENRLGKDKSEFKIKTCPKLEHISEKRVNKINKMSFAELRDAFKESQAKYKIAEFSDLKKLHEEDMEYIRRVIRERLNYIQESDTAIPRQNVKVITDYTENVADGVQVLNRYMSKLYDRINKLETRNIDFNNTSDIEAKITSKYKQSPDARIIKVGSAEKMVNYEPKADKTYASNQLRDLSEELAEIAKIPPADNSLDTDLQILLAAMTSTLQSIQSIPKSSVALSVEDKNEFP